MDITSLIIGLGLFVLFMFPIVYVLVKQNSKERKQAKALKKIAAENQLELDVINIYGSLALGLDTRNKRLIRIEEGAHEATEVIDLTAVSSVNLSKKSENMVINKIKKDRIQKLSLDLQNGQQQVSEIIFYSEEDEDDIDAEIRLNDARKWDDLLRKAMVY
ncbi:MULTISPECIES: hypothetical protein [Christiangramia]|uniref:Uncharacterized protein n=1 Tax=Christiangramia flava JLT2011 TaxID=1229726 RepID=A0A1L7I4K9_9FLAO|nr:hypothetical protein [Christiangramia flava]APU68032.1 hypothetical protein GRFL_1308 [Christiangramia flava JLT2011]OSS40534.1 hypothetical protein C723_0842 [Christiangramia flava JLT2011]